MSNVTTGKYRDEETVTIENDNIKVTVLPGWGSKLASIIYKPLDRELLCQNWCEIYPKENRGEDDANVKMSESDEVFPAVGLFSNNISPWSDNEVPENGEVWSVPWEYEIENDLVNLWVYGVRFPYKLEKMISLDKDCVYLKYKATNLSSFKFDFIWAAHPLFNTLQGLEFIVPSDGMEFDPGVVPEDSDSGYQKYYCSGRVTEGWCIFYNPEVSLNIGMRFPKEIVPYLGMWVNEGEFEAQLNSSPRPASDGMACVDLAKMWGMNSALDAHESIEWYLDIPIKKCRKARAVKENGEFVL
jgi:hypothetical protein